MYHFYRDKEGNLTSTLFISCDLAGREKTDDSWPHDNMLLQA